VWFFKRRHCTEHYIFCAHIRRAVLFHDPSAGKKKQKTQNFLPTEIKSWRQEYHDQWWCTEKFSKWKTIRICLKSIRTRKYGLRNPPYLWIWRELYRHVNNSLPQAVNQKKKQSRKINFTGWFGYCHGRPVFISAEIQLFLFTALFLLYYSGSCMLYPMCMKQKLRCIWNYADKKDRVTQNKLPQTAHVNGLRYGVEDHETILNGKTLRLDLMQFRRKGFSYKQYKFLFTGQPKAYRSCIFNRIRIRFIFEDKISKKIPVVLTAK